MKAYDNKTALSKSVLKTVMDPPGGLNMTISMLALDKSSLLASFFICI